MTSLALSNGLLWLVVIVQSVALLAVIRQLGVLHERITPAGALMLAKGLKTGEAAPTIAAEDMDGRTVSIGGARADERATLLVFVSPTCPICKALLPVLKSSASSEQPWLDIILASDGEREAQRAFIAAHRLEGFRYVVSTSLGVAYQVSRLPFAVLIDGQGVLRARGIVNSREHLESLFEAKRLGFASIQDYFDSTTRERAA